VQERGVSQKQTRANIVEGSEAKCRRPQNGKSSQVFKFFFVFVGNTGDR
jgi:hypothetical protein